MCHLTFCLSQFYLTLLVANYLKMKFKKEQVASIDCVYQEDIIISAVTSCSCFKIKLSGPLA